MKHLLHILSLTILLSIGCNSDPRAKLEQTGQFGQPDTASSFITAEEAYTMPDSIDGQIIHVTGTVSNYCKGEGCWLTLKNNSGEDLFVEVENKSFVLPYKIENKTAKITGILTHDSTESGKVSLIASGILIE